jgi:uncharacterized protein with GYD domain
MAYYLVQFSYAKEAVAAFIKKPEDRSAPVKALIEKLGGRMHAFYYCFGDYDGVTIVEIPDNVSCLAAVMAAVAPGHLSKIKTTVLLTMEESVEAMKKAAQASLPAPGR